MSLRNPRRPGDVDEKLLFIDPPYHPQQPLRSKSIRGHTCKGFWHRRIVIPLVVLTLCACNIGLVIQNQLVQNILNAAIDNKLETTISPIQSKASKEAPVPPNSKKDEIETKLETTIARLQSNTREEVPIISNNNNKNDSFLLSPIVNGVDTGSSFAGLYRAVMVVFEFIPISNQQPPITLNNLIPRLDVHDNRDIDIVLATHISTNKFQVLLTQLRYWKGPASVAVYIKTKEDIDSFFRFISNNRSLLKAVTFHLVMEKTDRAYPQNILRNVAMEAVKSEYVVLLDVDLIPMPEGCHDRLVAALKSPSSELLVNKRQMFVLPAFQVKPKKGNTHASEDQLPLSKVELLEKLKTKEVAPFYLKEFERGHGSTNFTKWINLPPSIDETYYDIPNKDNAFEPYVIAFKFGLPKYWEDFRGFGINKQSFFQECSRAGYTFAVLHNFYCIHLDHPRQKLSDKAEQLSANAIVHQHFMKLLDGKYPPKNAPTHAIRLQSF